MNQPATAPRPLPTRIVPRPRPAELEFVDPDSVDKYFHMLIIGPYGAGKTLLCGTAAADSRIRGVLFIDTEGESQSIGPIMRKYRHKIKLWKTPSIIRDIDRAYNYMKAVLENPPTEEGAFYPDTVVIDSATDVANKGIARITKNDARVEGGELPLAIPGPDWNVLKMYVENKIRQFKELECNLIVTCRENKYQDEATKRWVYQPLLPPSIAANFPSMFGEVLWLSVESGATPIRMLQCRSDGKRDAKDCSQQLPAEIKPNPTFTTILDYIYKERN